MKKRAKILSVLLSLVIVVAAITGCGNSESQTGDKDTENTGAVGEGEKFTIHYLTARSPEEGTVKALSQIAEMYKEENPGFNLEMEIISDRSSYLQKLKILASSDELPELFDSDADSFFKTLVEDGQVADVGALYEELGVDDKVYDNAKDYQRLDDGFLGLVSWQANTEYFWYNKTVFEKAGIKTPPKTFDEFFEVCDKLQKAGITPIAEAGGDTWPPLRYLAFVPFREVGNDFIEQARKGEISFGSDVGMDAADFMVKVAQYFQPGWTTADGATTVGLVTSGQAAMTYDGTWQLPFFVDEDYELKEDIGYFTLPVLGDDDATEPTDYWAHAGIGTAIRKDALDDNMKDFLKFVFENFADVCLYDYNTLPSFKVSDTDGMSELYKQLMDNYGNVKTYGYCWDVRIDSTSNEVLGRETPNLALGNITSKEWAKRLDEAVKQNVGE